MAKTGPDKLTGQIRRSTRFGIYRKILFLSLVISMTPILLLGVYTAITMDNAKTDIVGEIETAFDSKEREAIELQAFLVADAVSNFLKQRELDLSNLVELTRTPQAYAEFGKLHRGEIWIRTGYNETPHEAHISIPIYKEIAFIDRSGMEKIKIVNGSAVPKTSLKNVSDPKNTTYGMEDYFLRAKELGRNEIYVSHLTGYHMSMQEQLGSAATIEEAVESPVYNGVIRMARPVYEDTTLVGIVMLAIDHQHLMEFTQHILPNSKERTVFPVYNSGNYAFMLDDNGWIITHPKFWDIPGIDTEGNWVRAYNENSSEEAIATGRIPFNLDTAGFVHPNYPLVAQAIRRKESGSVVTTNAGGVHKIMAYAPILYNSGEYEKYGVFGGITIGAELEQFREPTAKFARELSATISLLRNNSIILVILTFGLTAFAAWRFSRNLARPILRMTDYARRLGAGESVPPITVNSNDEIGLLSNTLSQMANDLQKSKAELVQSLNSLRESKTETENYSRELEYQVSVFRSIQQVGNILGTATEMKTIQKFIMQSCVESLEFDRAVLYLVDKSGRYLEYQEQSGLSADDEARARRARYNIKRHDCIETRVLRTGQIVFVKDFATYPEATEFDRKIYQSSRSNSFVFAPLKVKEKVIGILGADKYYSHGPIREVDIHSLQIFANQVARLIESSHLYLEIVKQRNFFENIIQYMVKGIVTVDNQGRITSINEAASLIIPLESKLHVGSLITDLFANSPDLKAKIAPILEVISRGKGLNTEFQIKIDDKLITAIVSTINTDDHETIGYIIVLEDITEKKRMADRLNHLDRLASLGKFAAGIAHEIRNPLTGLSVFLDDLHDHNKGEANADFIAMAISEIERLDRLVNELLEYASPGKRARVEGGVNEIVEATLRFAEKQCENKELRIEKRLEGYLPPIQLNPEKMRQALLNIVLNAIQVLPEGGHIRVSTGMQERGRERQVRLTIEDSGPGIDPAAAKQIFEPFYTERPGGTGLGLSITHSIVVDHDGQIEVGRSELGGARFTIYLPVTISDRRRVVES